MEKKAPAQTDRPTDIPGCVTTKEEETYLEVEQVYRYVTTGSLYRTLSGVSHQSGRSLHLGQISHVSDSRERWSWRAVVVGVLAFVLAITLALALHFSVPSGTTDQVDDEGDGIREDLPPKEQKPAPTEQHAFSATDKPSAGSSPESSTSQTNPISTVQPTTAAAGTTTGADRSTQTQPSVSTQTQPSVMTQTQPSVMTQTQSSITAQTQTSVPPTPTSVVTGRDVPTALLHVGPTVSVIGVSTLPASVIPVFTQGQQYILYGGPQQYPCADADRTGAVVPIFQVCDGTPDCPDGSDEQEMLCPPLACWSVLKPIRNAQDCDNQVHCSDGKDEDPDRCAPFQCADGSRPVPRYWKCDGVPQCPDRSDEDPQMCRPFSCARRQRVSSVPWFRTCDGLMDCDDGSDERAPHCSVCANGWMEHQGLCFLFYLFAELPWAIARDACRTISPGADLLVVDTPEVFSFVSKTIMSLDPRWKKGRAFLWWIGFHDQTGDGDYMWLDGTPLSPPAVRDGPCGALQFPQANQPHQYVGHQCQVKLNFVCWTRPRQVKRK